MSISINPIFPVIAAQGAAPDLVLKPGTVIDAEVLKLLSDDLVRIAISGLSIEVFSEIPLRVGQALQLRYRRPRRVSGSRWWGRSPEPGPSRPLMPSRWRRIRLSMSPRARRLGRRHQKISVQEMS